MGKWVSGPNEWGRRNSELVMGKQRTDKREQTTDIGKWGKENRD